MPTTCEIEFENNPLKVIYSGETLRGIVHLLVTSEKVIKKGSVKIVGEGNVRWTEHLQRQKYDNHQQKYVTEYYTEDRTSQENYLHRVIEFIPENENVRLMPGTYNYPFEVGLPINLPTSFNGTYGNISYMAKVVLDVKSDWFDKKFETRFTVIKASDLNAVPRLREPCTNSEVKTFYPCCLLCCWESDPLEITISTPVSGYVPGQTINLRILAENKSNVPVDGFEAKLVKNVTYYAQGHEKSESNVVAGEFARGCEVYQNKEYRVNIKVPSIPPTEASASRIIKIQYWIQVTGSISGMHSDPELGLPIIIGVYPLLDIPEQQPPPAMEKTPMLPSAPPANDGDFQQPGPSSGPSAPPYSDQNGASSFPRPSAPMKFPNDEPPSYEAAMRFGEPSDKDFTPKYPMFKRQTSYSMDE